MTVSANAYKELARSQKTVLLELRDDRWLCIKEKGTVQPHMTISHRALAEIDEALRTELGRQPTEEEMQKRLQEMADSGAPLQEPQRGSMMQGTLEIVSDELMVMHQETPGGIVKVTIDPADVKHVNYVDEELIKKASAEALG